MAETCRTCWHPKRAQIERDLYAGRPPRMIVRDHSGVSVDSIRRHRKNHMPALLLQPKARRLERPDQAAREVGEVYRHSLSMLQRSEANGDGRGCVAALREVRRSIEFFARLHAQLPEEPAGEGSGPGSLDALIEAVTEALGPYPEAARAVAASLLEKDRSGPVR